MINLNKLPILKNNHEFLIDNDDYSELYQRINFPNIEDYLIVYSYSHDFLEVVQELIAYNIEFSHQSCHLSDESYLLINIKQ